MYTDEFKQKVIQEVNAGELSRKEVARKHGITNTTLRAWAGPQSGTRPARVSARVSRRRDHAQRHNARQNVQIPDFLQRGLTQIGVQTMLSDLKRAGLIQSWT